MTIQAMTDELLAVICEARRLVRQYNVTDPQDAKGKRVLLERLLGSVGEDVDIDTPFRCDFGMNTHIGDHVIVGVPARIVKEIS